MLTEVTIGVVSSVLSIVATKAVDWFRDRDNGKLALRKQAAADELAANQQAFDVYKTMVESLQATVTKLQGDLNVLGEKHQAESSRLEQKYLDVIKENGSLRADVKVLETKVQLLEGTVQPTIQALFDGQKTILASTEAIFTFLRAGDLKERKSSPDA